MPHRFVFDLKPTVLAKSLLMVTAFGFSLSAPVAQAGIWPLGKSKAKTESVQKEAPSTQAQTPNSQAPTPEHQAPEWVEPSAQEKADAMRAEPLVRATFFSRLFEHNPRDTKSGLILSDSLRGLGRHAEATDVAHRILGLEPTNQEALLAAARAHIADNNGFYAIDLLQQLSVKQPNNWLVYSLLGVAFDQTKRDDEAVNAWNTALRLSPNNPNILANQAMARLGKGQFDEAETLLRGAVSHPQANAQIRQNLALVLGLQGKMTEAEYWLRRDLPPEIVDKNLEWLKSNSGASVKPTDPAVAASNTQRSYNSLKSTQ